jgi:dymeclin
MQISRTSDVDLSENHYLKKFVGKEHIPATNDEYWNDFLQYHINIPTNR